jgi:hypothetical protein
METHGLGHKIGRGRYQPPSASVTFTNSFHPVNQHHPETAPASTVPENPVFEPGLLRMSSSAISD